MVADKDPINIDVQPIAESVVLDAEAVLKSVESTPATDLLKSDEPVAIPADLDFTPDEALNELVSSDILATVTKQPAEEVKEVKEEPAKITEPTETAAPEQTPTPAEVVVPDVVVADADTAVVDTTTSTATPATEAIATDDATAVAPTATAAAVVDEMNVENTEAASTVEAENAMEEAPPIKADEEQMDVDESNSTDAMDL